MSDRFGATRAKFASSAIWNQRTGVGAALKAFMPRWHGALPEFDGEQKPLRDCATFPVSRRLQKRLG
jgi:hypothetical protein